MGAMDPRISAAYESCRKLQLRHVPTYYWATRRLPADVRPATHALYGYVRTADQIVDGPDRLPTAAERRAALDAWEQELLTERQRLLGDRERLGVLPLGAPGAGEVMEPTGLLQRVQAPNVLSRGRIDGVTL